MKNAKIWALVLMGGGARGLAHIGVIRVLEKRGLIPDVVAGTSMGAIVGGLYAAGLSGAELTGMLDGRGLGFAAGDGAPRRSLFRARNLFEDLMLADYRNRVISRIGKDKGDAIEAHLAGLVGDCRIEDMPVRFVCNAVDLVSGREALFTKGRLCRALRASMSLPLVFAPVRMGGMLLLDGGVLNSAPIEAARALGAEIAVLVDVHRPIKRVPIGRLKSTFQIVQRTIEVAAAASFEERARHADYVLRIPIDLGVLNFREPRRIAKKGEKAAEDHLQELLQAIGAAGRDT